MIDDRRHDADQTDVIAFLAEPASHAPKPARVDRIETHGAIVFLAGDTALKIKRAVKLAYLDFSTLARREAVCRREIEINRPNAPEIYRDVVPITREPDGRLHIAGTGAPVEWAVRMTRFAQDDLLSSIADRQGIDDRLAVELAAMALRAHDRSPVRQLDDPPRHMRRIVDSVASALATLPSTNDIEHPSRRFHDRAVAMLSRVGAILRRRSAAGLVRRCHGDMHLGNIVLWNGTPQLFDAIEFDESLATIDVLYDLAFLLMDLDRRGQRRAARIVLDRYIAGSDRDLDLEALAALPLFLGLRAAIRSMVAFDRARIQTDGERRTTTLHASETLALAVRYLEPPPPRLIAIGGLSGTGKTTLAANIAPHVLPAPGALHLRTDVLRKTLAGVGELERLPPAAYTPEARAQAYAEVERRARLALTAGHSVVVDAVFAAPAERQAIEAVASGTGSNFAAIWLEASPDVMRARVAARRGDASDATPEVVGRQLSYDLGTMTWHRIEAAGQASDVLRKALHQLGLPNT